MLKKGYSESQMLLELKQGNEKALIQLYQENYTLVRNYVMQNNGKTDDVDDILQEAVIVVWEKVRKSDFELTSKLSTFLMGISKNLWLKRLSKDKRVDINNEVVLNSKLSVMPDFSKTDFSLVHQMLDKMDKNCKELLVLFYFKELENKVIAEQMKYSNTDVVKSKKYQCFKKLQELVSAKYNRNDFF